MTSHIRRILGISESRRHNPPPVPSSSSALSADTFVESEPTAVEWVLKTAIPTGSGIRSYIRSLFPFMQWIGYYNLQWLLGDVIAGVTVGFVVVPQGMAYALLAKLPPEYGLYTSFVGFFLYWAFATSKDITIGAVAVMSTIVGNIVIKVQKKHKDIPAEQVARGLALISGSVVLFIGLARCGWIVEFIPLVAIASFMTGAALSIAIGQLPALLGITGINTREATYKVLINTLKKLGSSKLDAATGLSALFMLYFIRWFCSFMSNRQPSQRKLWFFMTTLRMAFVILLYTMISWLCNQHIKKASKAKFKILGPVPRGFSHAGVPHLDSRLIKAFSSDLPATIIVLLIEHIAISKSFGRINNYTINPSQELVAIGFTNLFGPFLGGYPATGSFSRTAIKSKAGVRTPLAGVFTAAVVLLALYALTSVFFYIPMSSLAGLIIHAVGDLITPPHVVYQFWEVSPLEVPIFFTGVFVTIFTSIENGIYLTICASAALLLFRAAKTRGRFLGRVRIFTSNGDDLIPGSTKSAVARETYIPLDRHDGSNPMIDVQSPHPGVFVYRFSEGFNYPNQAHYLDDLVAFIFKNSRRTELIKYEKIGDRPWNDPGPCRGKLIDLNDNRPTLHAVVLDFSSVNNVDVTSVQGLIDARNQLDRYAAPKSVEWHFACINNRWTKRALAAVGFGYPASKQVGPPGHWKPILSFAEIGGSSSAAADAARAEVEVENKRKVSRDIEIGQASENHRHTSLRVSTIHGVDRPYFHIDLISAVQSAIANAEKKSNLPQSEGIIISALDSTERGS